MDTVDQIKFNRWYTHRESYGTTVRPLRYIYVNGELMVVTETFGGSYAILYPYNLEPAPSPFYQVVDPKVSPNIHELVADLLAQIPSQLLPSDTKRFALVRDLQQFDAAVTALREHTSTPKIARWFKNGDHPDDYKNDRHRFDDTDDAVYAASYAQEHDWEGEVVRRFRHPTVAGDSVCDKCGRTMHDHGWFDYPPDGQTVCPGSLITEGYEGRHYVLQCDADPKFLAQKIDGDVDNVRQWV